MDAKMGDWFVYSTHRKSRWRFRRCGSTLFKIATGISKKWAKVFTKGLASFHERF